MTIHVSITGPIEKLEDPQKTELELDEALNGLAIRQEFAGQSFSVMVGSNPTEVNEMARKLVTNRGWHLVTIRDEDLQMFVNHGDVKLTVT